ncbi:MAG TPA: hypothetical protein VE035_07820 [Puia sp.]|nr:hypothetical protein [Puia sp.]
MKKLAGTITYYLITFLLILIIHKLSPTNLAGPGLDLVVYFFALILSVALLGRSITKVKSTDRSSYWLLYINIAGTIVVTVLLYYVFTKKN